MTTARDIVSGAYCRLGLLPLGADLDPERARAGLSAYNDMLNAWAADGIFPGGPNSASRGDGWHLLHRRFSRRRDRRLGRRFSALRPKRRRHAANTAPLSLGLNDSVPIPRSFVEGAKALLAIELASASGMEALPSTQKRAQRAYTAMLAYCVVSPRAGQDIGLTWMPSLRRYGFR